MSRRYTVHDDGTIEPHVLTCAQAAQILGVDESTARRWVRNGDAPDANLPGSRLGIPSWWVTERITAGRTSPGFVVDLGERQGRTLTGYGRGAPATPRTDTGVSSSGAA